MSRRGTSLLELLLALAFLGLLVPIGVAVTLTISRASVLTVQRLGAERDATVVTGLIGHDLRRANASDLVIPAAGVLSYDRPIGEGLVCRLDATGVVVRRSGWLGTRLPQGGRDQLLVLETVDPAVWVHRDLTAIGAASCPDGGAGLHLVPGQPLVAALVVRIIEPVRLREYPSGGRDWLGLEHRGGGATIQPIAGPIIPGGWWLQLTGGALVARLDAAGGVTASLQQPLE